MSDLYSTLHKAVIPNLKNSLLKHFHSILYSKGSSESSSDGMPDISGYTLIFLVPPSLSGLSFGFLPSTFITSRNSVFQATEFSPPELQINVDQISSNANIKLPFAVGKTSGGQMSISYIENHKLDMYAFHNNWVHYIEQVILGFIDPEESYINSGELDYAGSAFVIRYKPDMSSMVYIGKAVGIFPVNLPNKEIIGSRQSPQLTTFTVNYSCADYREIALGGSSSIVPVTFADNMWVLADFIECVQLLYGGISLENIGSALISNLNNPFASIAQAQANLI
jgi:hypothetical protein